jgi:hypothetical protein
MRCSVVRRLLRLRFVFVHCPSSASTSCLPTTDDVAIVWRSFGCMWAKLAGSVHPKPKLSEESEVCHCPHLGSLARLDSFLPLLPHLFRAREVITLLKSVFTPQQLIGEERGVLEDNVSLSVAAKFRTSNLRNTFHRQRGNKLRHLVPHLACKCLVNCVNVSTPHCSSESSHNS